MLFERVRDSVCLPDFGAWEARNWGEEACSLGFLRSHGFAVAPPRTSFTTLRGRGPVRTRGVRQAGATDSELELIRDGLIHRLIDY